MTAALVVLCAFIRHRDCDCGCEITLTRVWCVCNKCQKKMKKVKARSRKEFFYDVMVPQ